MGKKRQYCDADKATALALLQANGGNLKRTSSELGLPQTTLRQWRDGAGVTSAVAEMRDQKKEALADAIEGAARSIVGHVAGKVADASLKDAAVALGVLVDKMQLLRGKPTGITGSPLSDLSDDDLDAELEAAERALAEGEAGEGRPRRGRAQGAA